MDRGKGLQKIVMNHADWGARDPEQTETTGGHRCASDTKEKVGGMGTAGNIKFPLPLSCEPC